MFLNLRHLCFRNEWDALSTTAGALGQFFFGTNDFFQLRIFSVPIFFGGPIRWNVKVQVRCLSSTDLFVQRSKNK